MFETRQQRITSLHRLVEDWHVTEADDGEGEEEAGSQGAWEIDGEMVLSDPDSKSRLLYGAGSCS